MIKRRALTESHLGHFDKGGSRFYNTFMDILSDELGYDKLLELLDKAYERLVAYDSVHHKKRA